MAHGSWKKEFICVEKFSILTFLVRVALEEPEADIDGRSHSSLRKVGLVVITALNVEFTFIARRMVVSSTFRRICFSNLQTPATLVAALSSTSESCQAVRRSAQVQCMRKRVEERMDSLKVKTQTRRHGFAKCS